MPGRTSILAVLLTATSVLAFAPAAEAAGWLEKNFWLFGPRYSGKLPPCDHPVALSKIKYLFGLKERRFWNSDRPDRRDLGRRMVRGRGRPQLGVQPGLQDGKALNRQFAHLPPAGRAGSSCARAGRGPKPVNCKYPATPALPASGGGARGSFR